jgi:hypothetical protein
VTDLSQAASKTGGFLGAMADKIRNKVFICSNNQQILGAKVSRYTLEKYRRSDLFEVVILNTDDGSELDRLAGQTYLRAGEIHRFSATELQSWTLIRFAPPELMNYQGKAVVIDPDVFAVGADVGELFERNMTETPILARRGKGEGIWASSVMVLDCARLRQWSLAMIVDGLLAHELDYRVLMDLRGETESIGEIEEAWNCFDRIDGSTRLLHTTVRMTQPWRTGLPLDMVINRPPPFMGVIPREWIHALLGRRQLTVHQEHPDPKVKTFFFSHLKGAVEAGVIQEDEVNLAVEQGQIRADIWEQLDRAESA